MEKLEVSLARLNVKEAGWSSLSVALRVPKTWEKERKIHYVWPSLNVFITYGNAAVGSIFVWVRNSWHSWHHIYKKVKFTVASNTLCSEWRQRNSHKSGLVKTCCNYRAGDVTLAQEDIVRSQLRFVIIDVFNRDVDFHKRLQTYKNTAGRR